MKYFVTGATGFIGGRLTRELIAQGHEVAIVARRPDQAEALAKIGVRVHGGDITDPGSLIEPMRGADCVFHLAAWYKIGARQNSQAATINIDGTRNVLATMRDLGIPKGVYTSTLAVFSDTKGNVVGEEYRHDGPWLSEYDRTKWLAHYSVALPMMAAGLPLVIVQPGLNYGPGDTSDVSKTLIQYLTRRLPMVPEYSAYCWAHVDDTVQGHIHAAERGKPGECYIIGGPPHTLIDALAVAESITGIPAPRIRAQPDVLKAASWISALVGQLIPLPDTYTAEGLRVVAGVTYLGSNEKAKRELGFAPRSLEDGLAETLDHEMQLLGMRL